LRASALGGCLRAAGCGEFCDCTSDQSTDCAVLFVGELAELLDVL
jgi:hypothetical protein